VTKQVERKEKETMTTIPLCSLNFPLWIFMTLQEFFLGRGGGVCGVRENLGARLEKKSFFSPNLL
jgi:hypothetical protein